jgi:S1-C subfamily serine protease
MQMIKTLILFVVSFALALLVFTQTTIIQSTTLKQPASKQPLYFDEEQTIKLFKEASPSVAFITTKVNVQDYWSRNVYTIPKGTGSGFVWDTKGHIVTNYHVIKDASGANIRFSDGKNYSATLVGASPQHDIAVLKIATFLDKKPPLKIGTSHDLQVGQKVFAIGNPFGLDYTLTSGIISALNRTLDRDRTFAIENLIQTDAAINPGNSGGPLLDSSGRLIGVNTAIYSPSGASAGVGFAVSVDIVNRVVSAIIAKGKYTRPTLGITINKEVNEMLKREYNTQGVVVLDVKHGSSAHRAGLRGSRIDHYNNIILGDIIIQINGKKVTSIAKLLNILDRYQVGDRVVLDIIRNQHPHKVEVVLE